MRLLRGPSLTERERTDRVGVEKRPLSQPRGKPQGGRLHSDQNRLVPPHRPSQSWAPVWAVGGPRPEKAVPGSQGAQTPQEIRTRLTEFVNSFSGP